jgi:dTDP-4-dehydrorhamnose 3,5-epimerase
VSGICDDRAVTHTTAINDLAAQDGGLGIQDVATVTPDGQSRLRSIADVVVLRPVHHHDHRGTLFEIVNGDPLIWTDPVVWCYQTSVRPRQIKGWARHELKTDRYCLLSGDLLVLLHDDRTGSPTRGVTQRVILSPEGDRQVLIPVGVWHMIINLGNEDAQLINFPTEPYHHDKPDRILLPWDTDELPVKVRDYLPKF